MFKMQTGEICFPPRCVVDAGFEIPDLFVVGYALDYNEYFRDLNVSMLELNILINVSL